MGKLIIPRTYVRYVCEPIIFLAGPIGSAPKWHEEAIDLLFKEEPGLIIASPNWGVKDLFAHYVCTGDDAHFEKQRMWENHYMDLASKKGAILFWLPGEEKHNCQKVYGATTRLELGEWITQFRYDPSVRFCIGSDGSFPEMSPIRTDLSQFAPGKRIFPSLEETCAEAIRLAYQK